MGLFRFLFGSGQKQSQQNNFKSKEEQGQLASLIEAGTNFDFEIVEAFQRYYSDPSLSVSIEVKDDKGNIYPAHIAYKDLFLEWTEIQSKWDRMSLLYKFWDESQIQESEHWQIIERYTKDRYPKISLKYFEQFLSSQESLDAKEAVAVSKMYRSLLQEEKARKYIEEAYRKFPDEDAVKVEYATVLHLSANHLEKESSHVIFHKVLNKKIKREDTQSIFECFLFSEGYVDSSVFAVSYLMTTEAALNQWDILADEYYHCPVFRYEHAVKLSQSDEPLRALAKLTSLSQEFPWFKTALETTVKNIHSMRKQLNSPDFMEKELKEFQSNLQS